MVALDVHAAFLHDAAALERPDVATLRLTGPDRVRFLNGMVSNDVALLQPGQGHLAIKTSNKGRIEALLRVRARPDSLEIDLRSARAEHILANLRQYIIMDDCALEDVTASREVISVLGPRAHAMLEAAGVSEIPTTMPMHGFLERRIPGSATSGGFPGSATSGGFPSGVVIRDDVLGVEGYELHVPKGHGLPLLEKLLHQGAKRASFNDLDVVRVEAGVPLDGRDLDDDTIPMEARLERALSTTKGCYIGQEVIARATNLGGVKHILVGLVLEGDAPPPEGTALLLPGTTDRIGELTSVVFSPTMGRLIALGYVHRKHEQPGNLLQVAVEPPVNAQVVTLPFTAS